MKVIFLNTRNFRNENLILFFENLNTRTRSEITKPELKISEPDPKYRNTRTDSTPLYRNTRKSKISDPNPNAYPNAHPYKPNSKYCNTAGQLKYHKSNMFFLTQVKCQVHHHIIFNLLHKTINQLFAIYAIPMNNFEQCFHARCFACITSFMDRLFPHHINRTTNDSASITLDCPISSAFKICKKMYYLEIETQTRYKNF